MKKQRELIKIISCSLMNCLLGRRIQLAVTIAVLLLLPADAAAANQVAKPGCLDKCGQVSIPYPFGIGSNCAEDHFHLRCNETSDELIYGSDIEVLNISLDGQIHVASYIAYDCYEGQSRTHNQPWLRLSKFTISSRDNKFVAIGCDTLATLEGFRNQTPYWLGCLTYCYSVKVGANARCSGAGCCQTDIPDGVTNITIQLSSFSNHTFVSSLNPCSAAAVVANDAFIFSDANFSVTPAEYNKSSFKLPLVLNWTIGNVNCESAKTSGTYLCQSNSDCYDPPREMGYRCRCLPGYEGNPYLLPGCQDIKECKDPNSNDCVDQKSCKDTPGSYYCECPLGSRGNGTHTNPCVPKTTSRWLKIIAAIFASVIGITVMTVGGFWLIFLHGKKNLMKTRQRFFEQNGGLILDRELARLDASAQRFSLFSPEELQKATSNYNDSNVVGRGAFGKVYKGILPNGQVIAVKKSVKIDPSQSEQFAKELIVLSKINHTNVVKLLGCCLEMDVPALVSEFISNGTLQEHLHDEAKASQLTWETRLNIATEVASVLSHLHTKASPPILHRDMKSANILLLDNYTAKVADFGCSKLVVNDPSDQVDRAITGTPGYLDPEAFVTGELTDKSDVYSFGVVLVELLTRKKPRQLASYFLRNFENHLFEILDEKIVSQQTSKQLKEVAHVARACLSMKGEERPTMREVEYELEGIRRTEPHPWSYTESVALQNQEEHEHLLHTVLEENGSYSTGIGSTTNTYQCLSIEELILDAR